MGHLWVILGTILRMPTCHHKLANRSSLSVGIQTKTQQVISSTIATQQEVLNRLQLDPLFLPCQVKGHLLLEAVLRLVLQLQLKHRQIHILPQDRALIEI